MKELIIVKLGGSVITKKSEETAEVNKENLKRLTREIAEAKKKKKFQLLLVHGAGPFGHVPARRYALAEGLKSERQIVGFVKTHQLMEELNFQVVKALQEESLDVLAFQPSAVGLLDNKKLLYFPTRVLEELLALNIIPVLYGDVLIDKSTGVNILSGDHLVPFLAKKLIANRVILCADVDGIFTEDPKKNEKAEKLSFLTFANLHKIRELNGSNYTDVTGGMKRKVYELLELARKNDIEVEIINGLKEGLLKRTLLGEKGLGTIIMK